MVKKGKGGEKGRENRYPPQAIDYYLNELSKKDVADKDRSGLTELEKILHSNTSPPAASGASRWQVRKILGKGGYGEVVLWQRKVGPHNVRCSFTRSGNVCS